MCLFPSGPFLIWGCSSVLSSSWAEPSSARSLSSTALSSGCLPRASAADLWSKPQELGAFLLCQLPAGVLSEEMLSWEVGICVPPARVVPPCLSPGADSLPRTPPSCGVVPCTAWCREGRRWCCCCDSQEGLCRAALPAACP